jgi:hypothetical protein
MKKIILSLITGFVLISSLEAALPPLYQSANEIKAILASEEFGQKLQSGELILTIQRSENGYEVLTNHHRLQVDILNVPSNKPGPIQFKLKFHDPIPVQSN